MVVREREREGGGGEGGGGGEREISKACIFVYTFEELKAKQYF